MFSVISGGGGDLGGGQTGKGGGELRGFIGRRPLTQKCQGWRPQLVYFLGLAVPILDCSGQEGRGPALCPCWNEFELPVMTSALAGGGGGGGQLWILYSMESLAVSQ